MQLEIAAILGDLTTGITMLSAGVRGGGGREAVGDGDRSVRLIHEGRAHASCFPIRHTDLVRLVAANFGTKFSVANGQGGGENDLDYFQYDVVYSRETNVATTDRCSSEIIQRCAFNRFHSKVCCYWSFSMFPARCRRRSWNLG